jgi:hypothetical protein
MDRFRRARFAWALAWIAVLLNAAAPAIAYGSLALRHVHQQGASVHEPPHHPAHEHSPAVHELAPVVHVHDASAHSAVDASSGRPLTPHCQYCFDFAAGAPLTLEIEAWPAIVPAASTHEGAPAFAQTSKPLLRLAYPRGPPPSAS